MNVVKLEEIIGEYFQNKIEGSNPPYVKLNEARLKNKIANIEKSHGNIDGLVHIKDGLRWSCRYNDS